MAGIQSKISARGQVSVPVEVLRQLGVGPGSVLEWKWRNGELAVRRAGKRSSEEIHAMLFGQSRERKPTDVEVGIRKYVRRRHARG